MGPVVPCRRRAGVSSPGHGCRNRTVSCQVHQRGKGLLEVWLLRPIDVMLCHTHWTQFPIACSRSFVPQPWNPWGLVAVVAWQISRLWRGIYCHDAGLVCARTTDQVESRESSRAKRLGNAFFFFFHAPLRSHSLWLMQENNRLNDALLYPG